MHCAPQHAPFSLPFDVVNKDKDSVTVVDPVLGSMDKLESVINRERVRAHW